MRNVMDQIQTTVEKLGQHAHIHICELDGVEYQPCGYKTDNTLPSAGWQPFPKGTRIAGHDGHFWFRVKFTTPAAREQSRVQLIVSTGFDNHGNTLNPQSMVYVNGKFTHALDTNHLSVDLEPSTDYEIHVYYYVGMIHDATEVKFRLEYLDERIEAMYYDMYVPMMGVNLIPHNTYEKATATKVLECTACMLDLNYPHTAEYYKKLEAAAAYLKKHYYEELCGKSNVICNCIGHTHIDVAWLWTLAQTREKAQRSFTTALQLMDRYPEYKFMMSQPQLFQFVKEDNPELYGRILEKVREGRFEIEGAMWLEADCNLISGESMVRQILHGKRFMKQEFDVDSRVLWLPDVFGYSAAMPQILKKSGVEHFITSKISWNDTNLIPYDTFMWQGLDGTEMLTDFITTRQFAGDSGFHNPCTYVGMLTPTEVMGSWQRYQQKEYNNVVMTSYGYGDGGGGPTAHMLEMQRRMAYGLPALPKTRMSTLAEHLEMTEKNFAEGCREIGRTPKWVGELYLEFHRGTYTSMAKNKRYNRLSEMKLQKTEAAETAAAALLGKTYSKEVLYSLWDTVLLNQFHDIIPGSSIKEVYDDSWAQYEGLLAKADGLLSDSLGALAENVKTTGGVLVYNSLGFARRGTVTVDGKLYETEEIPAEGWAVVQPKTESRVTVQGLTAENDFFYIELDDAGRIVKLIDKRCDRQVFFEQAPANEWQVFEDMPRVYDNWELAEYHKSKCTVLDGKAEITPIDEGCRKGFKICRTYHDSTIEQRLYLYDSIARVDAEHDIHWEEKQQILKIAFPTDINATTARYDIQFGSVERPTHQNTGWDEAKFEVCAQKWMDLSEYNYGVSILNDCKYGFNTEGSTMKLTVLKSGVYPNRQADVGEHTFAFAIFPHQGDFRAGGTVREAYSFNQPLSAVAVAANADGKLADTFSLVSTDHDNIIIDTVKQCEDSEDILVRLHDTFDCKTAPVITFGVPVKAVAVADLMENTLYDLAVENNAVKLPVKNFEIITLKVTLA
ncbi:MAG: alpha-mannosidase [Ruminococcaceae bacterium]|nr:alpha-mannosidase [Oscillospiraceae bacterium]